MIERRRFRRITFSEYINAEVEYRNKINVKITNIGEKEIEFFTYDKKIHYL